MPRPLVPYAEKLARYRASLEREADAARLKRERLDAQKRIQLVADKERRKLERDQAAQIKAQRKARDKAQQQNDRLAAKEARERTARLLKRQREILRHYGFIPAQFAIPDIDKLL